MSVSNVVFAIPLALGLACSHSGAQREHSAWQPSDPPPETAGEAADTSLAVVPVAGTSDTSSGSMGTSGSTGSSGSSSDTGTSGSQGDTGTSGSAGQGGPGAGGSTETMGAGDTPGSSEVKERAGDTGASGTSGGATAGAHEGDQKLMGKITKISKDELTVQRKGGAPKTLKLNDDTSVMVNGKEGKWSQLKKGQSVHATYENVGGEDVAVRVETGAKRQARTKAAKGDTGSR